MTSNSTTPFQRSCFFCSSYFWCMMYRQWYFMRTVTVVVYLLGFLNDFIRCNLLYKHKNKNVFLSVRLRHDMIACLGETTGLDTLQTVLQVMKNSPEGLQILSDKPRINSKTIDLDALGKLPVDTFGYAYKKFLDDNVCIGTKEIRQKFHWFVFFVRVNIRLVFTIHTVFYLFHLFIYA